MPEQAIRNQRFSLKTTDDTLRTTPFREGFWLIVSMTDESMCDHFYQQQNCGTSQRLWRKWTHAIISGIHGFDYDLVPFPIIITVRLHFIMWQSLCSSKYHLPDFPSKGFNIIPWTNETLLCTQELQHFTTSVAYKTPCKIFSYFHLQIRAQESSVHAYRSTVILANIVLVASIDAYETTPIAGRTKRFYSG